jgi:hypothetical protein|tara:strand:+ start:576 stop:1304 length:729 start_codon:yes stop_codon:yes gene_type:complete
MKMFSLIQNFICTQPSRLEVVKRNTKKLGDTFPDIDFYVNYNSDNQNFEVIKDHYLRDVPKLSFYNNLVKDWALVTLAMVKEVQTPYVMFICEDMEVNCSKEHMESTLSEFFENDFDWMFLSKIGAYTQQKFIDGFTPYNSIPSPGYQKMDYGYFYLGKHAPHKRLSMDMMCRTDFFIETLEEFLVKGEHCTHDIPFRKRHLPNFYEGYYDFANGMRRFPDLKCYIPSEVIFKEFNDVKDKA